ncbi:glutathione S-transferase family protein [Pseudoxanthomonas sp. LH2527]|uniref:glutathione S-transferase family protein n=1 Tax=Pseudoxanthomonas sp. LH2527 TaxID=2923249 RepID=UPI001F149345|nr:glutathione S-transferase family protein [Pseudoxanthomonas sp. LH2527]MCH6484667.1 glutathione S-transferase family protein [Pseudoxanthomonas sp. LH2527]
MSLPVLVIGNKNYSSWSLRPWLLLRHFGVAFDEVRLLLDTPGFADGVRHHSPTGKVPALHDGGVHVWDSLAICEYANERWLDGRGWPQDRESRALARAAAAEMHSGFVALRTQLPMNSRRTPDAYRWDAAAQRDIDRVQDLWRQLREAHGGDGDFLCGGFGIVDAMYAPVAIRFEGYGVEVDATAGAYMQALFALPAMREWRAAAAAETESVAATDALRVPL